MAARKDEKLKVGDRIGIAVHDPAAVRAGWEAYLRANGLDPKDYPLPRREQR